jgi:hypothetical protein
MQQQDILYFKSHHRPKYINIHGILKKKFRNSILSF